jgi:hypothetical protein
MDIPGAVPDQQFNDIVRARRPVQLGDPAMSQRMQY